MLVIGARICAQIRTGASRGHKLFGHQPRTSERVPVYAAPMKELRQALAGFYEIEAPLGRGGMALVYLARERRLDRRVALKVLSPDLAADESCRLRFLSEARTVARLTHPNIVPI